MKSRKFVSNPLTTILALLICMLATSPVVATEYHVSITTGHDANLGTEAMPWRTVTYGISQLYAGDTLWVHAGTYPASTYEFSRSGTAGSPITVAAWQDDLVYVNTTSNGFYVTREHTVIDGLLYGRGDA